MPPPAPTRGSLRTPAPATSVARSASNEPTPSDFATDDEVVDPDTVVDAADDDDAASADAEEVRASVSVAAASRAVFLLLLRFFFFTLAAAKRACSRRCSPSSCRSLGARVITSSTVKGVPVTRQVDEGTCVSALCDMTQPDVQMTQNGR